MKASELATLHRETSGAVAERPLEEVLLWYADLGVEVRERVDYHCPGCGTPLSMVVDEFVEQDNNEHLKCDDCRGPVEERGGAIG